MRSLISAAFARAGTCSSRAVSDTYEANDYTMVVRACSAQHYLPVDNCIDGAQQGSS